MTAENYYHALLARNHRAREAAAEYTARYEGHPLARQAATEGWQGRLMEYVQAAASYQSQLIECVPNPGFGEAVYRWVPEPEEKTADNPRDKEIARFLADARAATATGNIAVSVPSEAIAHWKRLAA